MSGGDVLDPLLSIVWQISPSFVTEGMVMVVMMMMMMMTMMMINIIVT